MFFKSFLEGPICQTCICFYFLALYIPYIVNSVMVLAELNQLGILALGLHPVAGFLFLPLKVPSMNRFHLSYKLGLYDVNSVGGFLET